MWKKKRRQKGKKGGREGKEKKKMDGKRNQTLIPPVSWCCMKEQYTQTFRMFRHFLKINGFFYTYIIIKKTNICIFIAIIDLHEQNIFLIFLRLFFIKKLFFTQESKCFFFFEESLIFNYSPCNQILMLEILPYFLNTYLLTHTVILPA